MARTRIKLAHERELLRLRTQKTLARIAVEDNRAKVKKLDAEIQSMKPKKPPSS